MATKREVESKLRELIARLAEADEAQDRLARTLPERRVISVRVPDLDADYWTVMADGRLDRLHRGAPDRADVRIRVDGDDLVAIVDGRNSLFSAFVSGQVKIEASVSDLLRLRKLA
jgi:predicted lipid carrier protein YhbT